MCCSWLVGGSHCYFWLKQLAAILHSTSLFSNSFQVLEYILSQIVIVLFLFPEVLIFILFDIIKIQNLLKQLLFLRLLVILCLGWEDKERLIIICTLHPPLALAWVRWHVCILLQLRLFSLDVVLVFLLSTQAVPLHLHLEIIRIDQILKVIVHCGFISDLTLIIIELLPILFFFHVKI